MMTNDNDPLESPDCMKEDMRLITGVCPECGEELEFFSLSELRNASRCYKCKKTLDTKAIAAKAGVSI